MPKFYFDFHDTIWRITSRSRERRLMFADFNRRVRRLFRPSAVAQGYLEI